MPTEVLLAMKGRLKPVDVGVHNAGETICPGGIHDVVTEQVSRARGYGRWMYCKYCYKHVLPAISRPNIQTGLMSRQIVCSECGCGLAPPEADRP